MKLLETTFLILTILIPSLFILLGIMNSKRFKKSKKFRKKLISFVLISLLLNGGIYMGIKKYDEKHDNDTKNTEKEKPNEKIPLDKPQDPKPPQEPEPNKTKKGFVIEERDGVTYIDGYMIANKTYPLPQDYIPTGTFKEATSDNCQECIIKEAYEAYKTMRTDASNQGLSLWIASGYRSYKYQSGLYNMYVNRSGKTAADTFSARPGHSEHQTGYAFDLNSVTDAFANTKEGKWVASNCQKYGFIIRYPKGKEDETGYKYESWHLRYVGKDLAEKLYNDGDWITMEDYFGIDSKYAN